MRKEHKVQIHAWKNFGRKAALVLAMTVGIVASAAALGGCSAPETDSAYSLQSAEGSGSETSPLLTEEETRTQSSEREVPVTGADMLDGESPTPETQGSEQEQPTQETQESQQGQPAQPIAETQEPQQELLTQPAQESQQEQPSAQTASSETKGETAANKEETESLDTDYTAAMTPAVSAAEGGDGQEETPTKEPLNVNISTSSPDDAHTGPGVVNQQELRGVWISYLEWNTLPKEQQAFQAAVNQMFDNCVSLGMNAVFVHVRPDADAMYPSAYFPWSKFASGQQGLDPGYDPLAYMIEAAHSRNLQFHAWFNPYRVTGYLNSFEDVAVSNPAKVWLTDNDPSNDRWVLLHDGFYYFNPSIPQVRELIINGVREVVSNYNVDGIHFDDYFYPTLNNANPALWFDKPEYDASGSALDITNWRRGNVNQLVRGVYAAVKEIKPSVVFGISPAGYVANLRSDAKLFVDIDTWMSQPGYIDYIMPQLYWGFEAKTSDKNEAPYAFVNNLNTWIELKNRGNVKLYLGLAMSRAGTNVADNNETSEWLRYNDILKRQVETARASQAVKGYCFFSYSSFYEAPAQGEVANLLPILK